MNTNIVVFWAPPGLLGGSTLFYSFVRALQKTSFYPLALISKKAIFLSQSSAVRVYASFPINKEREVFEENKGVPLVSCVQSTDPKLLVSFLDQGASEYNLCVLLFDGCSPFPPALLSGLFNKNTLFLCGFSPTLEDTQRLQKEVAQLISHGVSKEQIGFVLLNEGIPGGIPSRVVEKELGSLLSAWPYDPDLILTAENQGQLIQQKGERSALARALNQTAQKVEQRLKMTLNQRASFTHENKGDFKNWERKIMTRLWHRLDQNQVEEKITSSQIQEIVDQELERALLSSGQGKFQKEMVVAIRQKIFDQVLGLGPLEKFMQDPSINEIMVNGKDIFIEREGRLTKTEDRFENEQQLRLVIDKIMEPLGRRVDMASPFCDGRLPDGSRVNVVIPPLSLSGPLITIRRFRPAYQTIEDLLRTRSVTELQAKRLKQAVQNRENILISGNTGSGKTTLLNILSGFIPGHERIITLEDAAELQLRQEHVVRLETRSSNAEGVGEVSMLTLLINALRMRPDRLIIGECRGDEAVPMIQAMNTGHDGSMTTIHANSAADSLKRLEAMILLAAPQWPIEVIRQQIAAGINLILHMKREGPRRTLTEIRELKRDNSRVMFNPVNA